MTRSQPFILISYIFIFLLSSSLIAGADVSTSWRILSPVPESSVKSGELFIVVALRDSVELKRGSASVYLDGMNISSQAKVSSRKISLLYLRPLGIGNHKIEIKAKDVLGYDLPFLHWSFFVGETGISKKVERTVEKVKRISEKVEEISKLFHQEQSDDRRDIGVFGNLEIGSRNEFISDAGYKLRQEPAKTNTFNLTVQPKYKSFTFPIRIFATSDENNSFQPRNRLQLGAKSKMLELYYGDNNPTFDRMILNGARIRGLQTRLNLGGIHIDVVHGDVRRGVEGQKHTYSLDSGFPPSNLDSNSTYISPGTYKRKLTAARLSFGSERSVLLGITGLKAKDDTLSISYGQNPKENLVLGSDVAFKIKNGLVWFNGGAAISLTTNNIFSGPATKSEIDSLFDINIPFNPTQYDYIITINTSTVPMGKLSSLSWYARSRTNLFSHSLMAEFKSFGPAYTSFGNPYLRNDRKGFTLSDRFHLWKRKVTASLRYQQYVDNLADNQVTTRKTHSIVSNISIAPKRTWPRLNVGVRSQLRKSPMDSTDKRKVNDAVMTYTFGGHYNFRAFNIRHGVNMNMSLNKRSDKLCPERETTSQMISLGFVEQLPIPLTFQLQFMALRMTSASRGRMQDQKSFMGNARYRLGSGKLHVLMGFRTNSTRATQFAPQSRRSSLEFGGIYKLLKDMSFELKFGYSSYREKEKMDRNYSEKYFVIRHVYGFNFQ